MRIRRKPWARPELAACDFFIDNPILFELASNVSLTSTIQQDYTDSDTGIKYKVYSVRNMPSSQSVTEFRFTIGKYSA